ncbi:MAG: hypothetical protein ABIV47_01605, partial [Roseiflexaceae bacterium]
MDIYTLMEEKGYPTPGQVEYNMLMAGYNAKLAANWLMKEEYERKKRYAEGRRGNGRWGYETIYNIIRKHEFYAGKFT